ncbi:MAG: hypothetical protein KOO69_05250 [Victivallales bacterium]|nr:hypothetical protein [Victivallales bacterium]
MEDCKKCNGTGYIRCDACKGGLMEVPCPVCDGDGWLIKPGYEKQSACASCQGEGDLDSKNCSVCHGARIVNCSDCNSIGK